MDEAYQPILAWLDKEFPGAAYPSEPKDDASSYLPAGFRAPELEYEPIEVFAKRDAPSPASRKELVVVHRALEEFGVALVVAALWSQGIATRLRKTPAVRLLLEPGLDGAGLGAVFQRR